MRSKRELYMRLLLFIIMKMNFNQNVQKFTCQQTNKWTSGIYSDLLQVEGIITYAY